MLLRTLTLSGVRNLANVTLDPGAGFNVFAGENGQGKTNLLEAVYAVCTLRSFRTRRLADLIGFDHSRARLYTEVERGGSLRTYELVIDPSSRKVLLDGKAVRPLSKYFGGFQVVLFAPEDLAVPRGAPSERRGFLDRAVFQRAPDYLAVAQDYDRVLRSRNAVLKAMRERGSRDTALLEVYDLKLAELGAKRVARRASLLAEIEPRFAAAFESIGRAGQPARLRYLPNTPSGLEPPPIAPGPASPDEAALAAWLLHGFQQTYRKDLARAATTLGPHRDDLEFLLGDHSAASFASQGQLRAMVLAWKIAETELLAATSGEAPILLLDDVSSELDPRRNQYLFDFLAARRTQCFITTTHPRHVLATSERVDYEVHSGHVRRQNLE